MPGCLHYLKFMRKVNASATAYLLRIDKRDGWLKLSPFSGKKSWDYRLSHYQYEGPSRPYSGFYKIFV